MAWLTDAASVKCDTVSFVQRARSAEHREQRLAAILDATASRFDLVGPDLTLGQIAEATGLTRTTLYGYASTREELLLLLTDRELTAWFARLKTGLASRRTVRSVTNLVVDELLAQPRLAPLLALCGVLIERNVSLDAAVIWKSRLQEQVTTAGGEIDRICGSSAGSGARFLLHVYASLTGLYSLAFPTEIALKAIEQSGSSILLIDFETELRMAITSLAHALLA
jgi:AcrR family transcriptional regulator